MSNLFPNQWHCLKTISTSSGLPDLSLCFLTCCFGFRFVKVFSDLCFLNLCSFFLNYVVLKFAFAFVIYSVFKIVICFALLVHCTKVPIAEETPIRANSRSPIYSPDTPLTRVMRCVSAEPALSPAVMDEVEITAADVPKASNHLPDSHSTCPGKRAPCQDLLSQFLCSIPRIPVTSLVVLFHPAITTGWITHCSQ